MSGADVELATRDDGDDLIRGSIWGFAWSGTAFPADFSCVSYLGASSPAQRQFIASFLSRGSRNLGIAVSHAENAKSMENGSFLKKKSVATQDYTVPNSASVSKGARGG